MNWGVITFAFVLLFISSYMITDSYATVFYANNAIAADIELIAADIEIIDTFVHSQEPQVLHVEHMIYVGENNALEPNNPDKNWTLGSGYLVFTADGGNSIFNLYAMYESDFDILLPAGSFTIFPGDPTSVPSIRPLIQVDSSKCFTVTPNQNSVSSFTRCYDNDRNVIFGGVFSGKYFDVRCQACDNFLVGHFANISVSSPDTSNTEWGAIKDETRFANLQKCYSTPGVVVGPFTTDSQGRELVTFTRDFLSADATTYNGAGFDPICNPYSGDFTWAQQYSPLGIYNFQQNSWPPVQP